MAVAMRTAAKEHSKHESIAIADPFPGGRATRNVVLRDEHGQAFAEYGLILALVVLVAMAGLSVFGGGLAAMMTATFNAVVATF